MADIIIRLNTQRYREVPERWDGRLDRKATCSNCALKDEPLNTCRDADRALAAVANNRRASCVTRHSMWEEVSDAPA